MSSSTSHYTKINRLRGKGRPVRVSDRVVGEIVNGVLIKHASPAHMLREPRAWAWDKTIVDMALAEGVEQTIIVTDETKTVYEAPLEGFRQHGIEIDRGFGPQIALRLEQWTITSPAGSTPARREQPEQPVKPEARQMSLWGEG